MSMTIMNETICSVMPEEWGEGRRRRVSHGLKPKPHP